MQKLLQCPTFKVRILRNYPSHITMHILFHYVSTLHGKSIEIRNIYGEIDTILHKTKGGRYGET